MEHQQPEPREGPQPKKPYSPPRVVEYGNVAKLTRGSNGNGADAGNGMTMMCL
jgi:hypothetical protein